MEFKVGLLFLILFLSGLTNATALVTPEGQPQNIVNLDNEQKSPIELQAGGTVLPKYYNTTVNDLNTNYEEINFDALVSTTSIKTTYPGFDFSVGYLAIDTSADPNFKPSSGNNVATSSEILNNITIKTPVDYFSAYFINQFDSLMNISGYNDKWELVVSEDILPYSKQVVKLSAVTKPDKITYIRVGGLTGFNLYWVMDDIKIYYNNSNLINFEDLTISDSIPFYDPVSFPHGAKLVYSNERTMLPSLLSVALLPETFIRFDGIMSRVSFFVTNLLPSDISVLFYHEIDGKIFKDGAQTIKAGKIDQFVEAKWVSMFTFTGENFTGEWNMDNLYFDREPEPVYRFHKNYDNQIFDRDMVDGKVDTVEISAQIEYENLIYAPMIMNYTLYLLDQSTQTYNQVVSFSELFRLSGSGNYTSSKYFYNIETAGIYAFTFDLERQSSGYLSPLIGYGNNQEFGVYYGPVLNIAEFGGINASDDDGDGGYDTISVPYDFSWYYQTGDVMDVVISIIRGQNTLTSTSELEHTEIISTTMMDNGSISDIFKYHISSYNFYTIDVEFLLNNNSISSYTVGGNLYPYYSPKMNYEEGVILEDRDGDGGQDTLIIDLLLNYTDNEEVNYHYQVIVTMMNTNTLKTEIVSEQRVFGKLNGTGIENHQISFQANTTGTYRVGITFSYGFTSVQTPLSVWFNSLPIFLDGVGDDLGGLISVSDGAPISVIPFILTMVAVVMFKKKK